jgi:cytochrome c biogenesis protein CcmG/thiol:disulfide interchange protein DsbE
MKNIAVLAVLCAASLGLIGGIYFLRQARAAQPVLAASSPDPQAPNTKPVLYFVKDPELAPAFQVKDLNGKPVNTADWKGKAVLLNFWATWCPPCREEIPALIALQKKYEGRLVIVGVSEDEDSPDAVLKFANRLGINYQVVMSTPEIVGKWGGVEALPTTFLVNSQGRVVGKNRGERPQDYYDLEIRALLGDTVDARIETIADQGQVFLKNAANATELPDVDMIGLTADQKKQVLHRLNAETCTCGCKLTLAQCRLNDSTCPVSKTIAANVVNEVKAAKVAPTPASPARVRTLGNSSN